MKKLWSILWQGVVKYMEKEGKWKGFNDKVIFLARFNDLHQKITD